MYFFFEFMLIPLFLMIFGWGNYPERFLSGLYLFFYTFFGSLPLLFIIFYLYSFSFSFFFDLFYFFNFSFFIHFFLFFAFLISLPLFMLHFWLPKAHVQAPVFGSMILAGIVLSVGGYGIFRFMIFFENSFFGFSFILYSLSIYGSLYVSFSCFFQGDLSCMIAFSSICHMCFCLLGLLSMNMFGVLGFFFMMISHGFCSSCLFYMCNLFYSRIFSRSFFLNSGLINFIPSSSIFWFIFCCLNMGCPIGINFFSELFILFSLFDYWPFSFFFFIFISFFSSCFSFYLFSYLYHGQYNDFYSFSFINIFEYLIIFVHFIPIFFLLFIMDFF